MAMRNFVSVFILLDVILFHVDASQLFFHTNEPVIHPVLTKTLTLRCSVLYDANSINALRPRPAEPTPSNRQARQIYMYEMTNATVNSNDVVMTQPAQDTTSAPYDVSQQADIVHVMSIIVSKEMSGKNVSIAKVTPYDPASASTWLDTNIKVQGNCETSPAAGEQAYLELTWVAPKDEQAGKYKCEIFALNTDSLPVSLQTSLFVTSSEPTFVDLISYVTDHDKIITDQRRELYRLNGEIISLQSELDELRLNSSTQIDYLKDQLLVLATPSIESGFVTCPVNTYISFQKLYRLEPLVMTNFVNISSSGSYNTRSFSINVNNVTTTGFSLYCTYTDAVPAFKWIALVDCIRLLPLSGLH
ncbi:hypothetical protein Btru_047593 [Bulinus truncatus]|nr:hypothetical protein Btru_047593 [Bulinus truncatus]